MTKKILIVSKERGLAQFTSVELQKSEFLVDVVDDGKSALTFLRDRDYDLILVDFILTDMTSQDFAEQLSLFKPASVLIVIADREEAEKHQEAIGQYAVALAVRPLVIDELIDQIHRIFRGREFIDRHCTLF